MVKINKENIFLNKIIILILLILLVLMPFGTFLIQLIKLFFENLSTSLPSFAVKILYGWKEILLVLGLILVAVKIFLEKKFPFKINKFDIIVFLIMFLGLVYGGLLVGRLDRIVFGFRYDFLVFLFYFLARSVIVRREDILKYIKIVICLSIPVMLFGIFQTFLLPKGFMEIFGYSNIEAVTGNPLPPYHLIGNTVRAMSTFPGPNSLAMYLVFIFLAVLFFGKELFNKYFKYFLIFLSFFTLIITFSRAHITSLVLSLVFVILFFRFNKKDKNISNNKIPIYPSVVATVVILLVSVLSLFGTFWLADLSKNQDSLIESVILRETSTQMHSFMRNLAIEPIRKQPWGYGIGTAGMATTNIPDAKFNPESWPIQLIFEYGLLGLIIFITIIYNTFNLLLKLFTKVSNQRQRRFILFFITFFVAIIISTNFLPSWFEVGSLMWWIFFGLFLSNKFENNN